MFVVLVIYTVLIVKVAQFYISVLISNSVIKKYNEYMINNDYTKAIELIESNRLGFGMYKAERKCLLINLYFAVNDIEKYEKVKNDLFNNDLKKNKNVAQYYLYSVKITAITFMYLHEEIDKANIAYEELIKSVNEIEKVLYQINIFYSFQVLKLIYAFHGNDYTEAKRIYNYMLPVAYGNVTKTLISYYMCKIFEIEGNEEAIKAAISDIEIQNNVYRKYFERWIDEK